MYNVAGLGNKLIFGNFFSYLNEFDIIFLFETHIIEDRFIEFDYYFRDFKVKWLSANRTHNIGRASGGCLFGFKRKLEKRYSLEFTNFLDNIVLKAKFGNCPILFVPKYVNCTN